MRNPSAHLRSTSALALAAFALAAPAPVLAQEKPPNPHGNVSSIDEYVEDIPTASGPVPSQRAKPQTTSAAEAPTETAPVPRTVAQSIKKAGGADSERLTEIVSTPDVRVLSADRTAATTTPAGRAGAVGDAVTSDDSELIVLGFALAGITLAAIGVAARRRARRQ